MEQLYYTGGSEGYFDRTPSQEPDYSANNSKAVVEILKIDAYASALQMGKEGYMHCTRNSELLAHRSIIIILMEREAHHMRNMAWLIQARTMRGFLSWR